MQPHIAALVGELVKSSEHANLLVSRSASLSSMVETNTLSELRSQISTMSAQIRTLQAAIAEIPDAEFSDVEEHEFRHTLMASIKEIPVPRLVRVYSLDYFRPLPKNVRLVIASCLVNEFQERGAEPLDFWLSILAKNGATK